MFKDVGFIYPGAERWAVRHLSFTLKAGEVVALVGENGAGKTTLVKLLTRLYDPDEGRILLDGHDLRELRIADVRRAVALVFEETFLFSESVRENIRLGRPDASNADVVRAAELAGAAAFVDDLPDGYETVLGERGFSLSGGQRQRIAIARALLADPRVLILDDATSSVDASTEQSIKLALAEAMAGRTTFVIAHRLSTIALADEIVVLEHGRIVAPGNHEELLQASELYREIVAQGAATDPQDDSAPAFVINASSHGEAI